MTLSLTQSSTKSFPKNKIRYIYKDDIRQTLEIDNQCYNPSLTEEDLLPYANKSKGVCKVYEVDGNVVAFHIYSIKSSHIEILKLGVNLEHRRMGYGTKLIKEAYRKLTKSRNKLCCVVSEFADDAISFLKKSGFIATSVKRGCCSNGNDGYSFRLVLQESLTLGER